jgi:hypothetical protein
VVVVRSGELISQVMDGFGLTNPPQFGCCEERATPA